MKDYSVNWEKEEENQVIVGDPDGIYILFMYVTVV